MELSTPISPREDTPFLGERNLVEKENGAITWLKTHERILIALLIISTVCVVASLTYMFLNPFALIPMTIFLTTLTTSEIVMCISFLALLFINETSNKSSTTFNAQIDFDGFDS
jgi:hypothetical protein